jgi:hypothetical protein
MIAYTIYPKPLLLLHLITLYVGTTPCSLSNPLPILSPYSSLSLPKYLPLIPIHRPPVHFIPRRRKNMHLLFRPLNVPHKLP